MKKSDYRNLGILIGVTLLIFYPVFYTHYFYTDEVLQLWLYRKGSAFAMFVPQGRFITDRLFHYLYSSIDTIPELTRLRLFSLAGWILCLPVWYTIIAKTCRREGLSTLIPFFSVLYLVVSPPFSVSIQWAACMEMFIANTAGLIAGYIIYAGIRYDNDKIRFSAWRIVPALLFGLISLSSYQNGFGCFLLPFFLQAISEKGIPRSVRFFLPSYFFVYGIYFLLFKFAMSRLAEGASARTELLTNPLWKLCYMFFKPLPGAFYFNWIVREKSIIGRIIYILLFAGCMAANLLRLPNRLRPRLAYILTILAFFFLAYLPSLVVKEDYASNRTLLALDMTVFVWVFTTFLELLRDRKRQLIASAFLGLCGVMASCYNLRHLFLLPATTEYEKISAYIDTNYRPGITTIAYIRSSEDLPRRKYAISSSWDEFGMSSSWFAWVPDALVRQLVFEKTADRSSAEKLTITNWKDRDEWQRSGQPSSPATLVVDVDSILR